MAQTAATYPGPGTAVALDGLATLAAAATFSCLGVSSQANICVFRSSSANRPPALSRTMLNGSEPIRTRSTFAKSTTWDAQPVPVMELDRQIAHITMPYLDPNIRRRQQDIMGHAQDFIQGNRGAGPSQQVRLLRCLTNRDVVERRVILEQKPSWVLRQQRHKTMKVS
jgi:hypothetical protein